MRPSGFTYIGLLILVAIIGVSLLGLGTLWSTEAKREKEAELLFVGDQFRRAIASYYDVVPSGQQRRFPAKLEDLVEDRRWPTVRRHLRKVYLDPITGTREWGIVRGPGETIMGVYSLSTAKPFKHARFPRAYEEFAAAASYQDWRFEYSEAQNSRASGGTKTGGASAAQRPAAATSPSNGAPNLLPSAPQRAEPAPDGG